MMLAGGYTDVETPSSIPNLEAKRIMADDTLPYWDGNVGRCRLINTTLYLQYTIPFFKTQSNYHLSFYHSTFYLKTLIVISLSFNVLFKDAYLYLLKHSPSQNQLLDSFIVSIVL